MRNCLMRIDALQKTAIMSALNEYGAPVLMSDPVFGGGLCCLLQGHGSVHHILSDHGHSSVRDTVPSGGGVVGGVRVASPPVS